ncbi:MAG: chitobiase/beta-hexosaminidase C-terminal domain-containing protein, partial [Bacteroidia bacterium]|nr:chitobiase/beta-hexosaminidase C-terminal domain-containing protein [Bacteroidia bacterium]
MKRFLFLICSLPFFSLQGQIFINEICPANADINYDPDFYNFSCWIELYNGGNSNVTLDGYYLSDNTNNKGKWRIPNGTIIQSKGYQLIWCDEMNTKMHTNFKLDSEGEELILSNPTLTQVDQIVFPKQYTNVSYGRKTDGASSWSFHVEPTPGKINSNNTATVQLETPSFSLSAGRYPSTQSITIKHSIPSVEILYTTDGSEPTINSTKYVSPISIPKTTTLKAISYLKSFIPSKTEVKTYFINEHEFTLPVISLSTGPSFLTNSTIGIYVEGSNGIKGNCKDIPVNWNQDWSRHAAFEFFKETGKKEFDQDVDIRIGGGCSRNNPKKS